MQDPVKLNVFSDAEALALLVYAIARELPREEQYGLAQQMRRAAVSVGSNIAEGCGRSGARELARFLDIAQGSAMELEFQLRLAHRLDYLAGREHQAAMDLVKRVQRRLSRLGSRIRPALESSRGRPKTEN